MHFCPGTKTPGFGPRPGLKPRDSWDRDKSLSDKNAAGQKCCRTKIPTFRDKNAGAPCVPLDRNLDGNLRDERY